MGIAVSDEILLNDNSGATFSSAKYTHTEDGGWIITWLYQRKLLTQRYDSAGQEVGDTVIVAKGLDSAQSWADATIPTDAGGWVQSYTSWKTVAGKATEFFNVALYDANGALISRQEHLATNHFLRLEMLANDNFIVFDHTRLSDYQYRVKATIYDENGDVVTKNMLVGTDNDIYDRPLPVFNNGTWSTSILKANGSRDYLLFDADGTLLSSVNAKSQNYVEFQADGSYDVFTTVKNDATHSAAKTIQHYDSQSQLLSTLELPKVTYGDFYSTDKLVRFDNGNLLLVWEDGNYGKAGRLHSRLMDSSGHILVADTLIYNDINFYGTEVKVLELSTGDWVLFWDHKQQAFNADGSKNGKPVEAGYFDLVVATDDGGWTVAYDGTGKNGSTSGSYIKTFHLNDINNAPEAFFQGVFPDEDKVFRFDAFYISGYDYDGDDITQIAIDSLPSVGKLTYNGTAVQAGDTIAIADLKNLTWTPPANLFGDDAAHILYRVIDEHGLASGGSAQFNFNLRPVDDTPWSGDIKITVLEDEHVRLRPQDIPFHDLDRVQYLDGLIVKSDENNGSLTADGLRIDPYKRLYGKSELNKIFYIADENESGRAYDTFHFRIIDSGSTHNNIATAWNTLTFNVVAVNDAPRAENNSVWINAGQRFSFFDQFFAVSDIEHDKLKSIRIDEIPEHGVLRLGSKVLRSGDEIAAKDLTRMNFFMDGRATGNDSFTFFARDDGGTKNGGDDIDQRANSFSFLLTELNVLYGTRGRDALTGSNLTDVLVAGAGNDLLKGGSGDDKLHGGSGADVFVMHHKGGDDRIFDFDVSEDRIDLRGTDLTSFRMLQEHYYQNSSQWLSIGYDYKEELQVLFLENVLFRDLSANNFIF